jgi:hypothetical protein
MEAEDCLVRILVRQPVDEVISVPTAQTLPGGDDSISLMMRSVEP